MAYQIQQRRDTKANWESVNPVLADAEIGFILDKDENGVQKSSLFKIGDGETAWNQLPLFGFTGNVLGAESAWKGSDLDLTVASQQAVLNKIAEKIAASEEGTEANLAAAKEALELAISNLLNGVSDAEGNYTEGLVDKLSKTQLIQSLAEVEGEFSEEDDKDALMADQIASRKVVVDKFAEVDATIATNKEDADSRLGTLESTSSAYVPKVDTLEGLAEGLRTDVDAHYEELRADVDKHEKDIYTWTEEVDTEETDPETGEVIKETIVHKGFADQIKDVDDKVTAVESKFDSMHHILTQRDYNGIDDFSSYADGTLFFTYEDKE